MGAFRVREEQRPCRPVITGKIRARVGQRTAGCQPLVGVGGWQPRANANSRRPRQTREEAAGARRHRQRDAQNRRETRTAALGTLMPLDGARHGARPVWPYARAAVRRGWQPRHLSRIIANSEVTRHCQWLRWSRTAPREPRQAPPLFEASPPLSSLDLSPPYRPPPMVTRDPSVEDDGARGTCAHAHACR